MILPVFTVTLEPSDPLCFSLEELRSFFHKKSADYTRLRKDSAPGFIHRYPVVQCKQVKNTLMVIGIGQGADLLQEVSDGNEEVRCGGTSCIISGRDPEIRKEEFGISDKIRTYEFLTPWLALNQQNARKFYDLKGKPERDAFMQKILSGHLGTLARSLDYDLPAPLSCESKVRFCVNGFIAKMSWSSWGPSAQISGFLITWESGSRFRRGSGRYAVRFRIPTPDNSYRKGPIYLITISGYPDGITSPICDEHKTGIPDFLSMLWILLALLGAIANASYFIIIKRHIATLDPKVLTGAGFTCGGLLLLAFSAIRGFPVTGEDLYSAVAVTAVLNIISLALIFRALSSTDLSLSIPMLSFTPVNSCRHFLSHPRRSPVSSRGCRHLHHCTGIVCAEYLVFR